MREVVDAVLFVVLLAVVYGACKALRGHFADRRRFPGQMDERLEGMAKVAQGATEMRGNGTNGECVGSLGSGGRVNDFNRFTEAVAKEANK